MPAPAMPQLPPFEGYSDEGAVAFYLGDQTEPAAASADAVFVVENCALPVHSWVLGPRLKTVAALVEHKAEHSTVPLLGGPCGYTLGPNGEHLDVSCGPCKGPARGTACGAPARAGSRRHLRPPHTSCCLLTPPPHTAPPFLMPPRPLQVLCSDLIPASSDRSLSGATLKRVAHFLRFAYDPAEVRGVAGVGGCGKNPVWSGWCGDGGQQSALQALPRLHRPTPPASPPPKRAQVAAIDVQLPGAAKSLSAAARLAHQMGGPELLEALDLKMEEAGAWG